MPTLDGLLIVVAAGFAAPFLLFLGGLEVDIRALRGPRCSSRSR